jgi:hypothetical protein
VRQRLRRVGFAKIAAACAVALVAGAATVALASGGRDRPACDAAFDRAAWNSYGDERTREAHRLADCEHLIGVSRAEIGRLLGPAQERDPARREVCFELGPDALSIDSEFLCIGFKDGVASRTRFFGA